MYDRSSTSCHILRIHVIAYSGHEAVIRRMRKHKEETDADADPREGNVCLFACCPG